MITQKSARLSELGLLDELRVITSAEEVSERTRMCYNTLTNRKELA